MARRQRNRSALAGLAALGALGYISGKGPLGGLYKRREDGGAPVEFRGLDSRNDPAAYEGAGVTEIDRGDRASTAAGSAAAPFVDSRIDEDIRRFSDVGTNFNELGQPYSLIDRPPAGSAGPAASLNRSLSGQMAGAGVGAGANRADLRGFDDMYANRPAAAPVTEPRATGRGGFAAQDIRNADGSYEALERRRLPGRAAATAPQRNLTREEAIAAIPGQRTSGPQGGERVTGNETSRNIQNLLNAPVPGMVPFGRGAGAVGRAASTSREVGSLKETPVTFLGRSGPRPVRGPERLEGGRTSQPRLTDDKASRAAIEAERRKRLGFERKKSDALDESDWTGGAGAYGAKKGGAIKTKKMASGGMASASKRGDGIASKGKTKCKMY